MATWSQAASACAQRRRPGDETASTHRAARDSRPLPPGNPAQEKKNTFLRALPRSSLPKTHISFRHKRSHHSHPHFQSHDTHEYDECTHFQAHEVKYAAIAMVLNKKHMTHAVESCAVETTGHGQISALHCGGNYIAAKRLAESKLVVTGQGGHAQSMRVQAEHRGGGEREGRWDGG